MINDRRLYSPAPDLKGPVSDHRSQTRICLIAAAALMFALMAFVFYTGTAVLYIHYWVYVAAAALIILLLLGAGAFAIHGRLKGERARRNTAIILIGVMALLGTMAMTLCTTFADLQKPLGIYASPEGENRIVVFTSDMDEGSMITAYPAIGNHFYVAALESEMIHSNGIISGVEWEGERLAKVKMEDINGNDVELTVDFAPLYGGEGAAAE